MKLQLSSQQLVKLLATIVVIGVSITGIILLQKSRIKPPEEILTQKEYQQQEQLEKIQLDVLKGFPTLGYNNLMADWLYLRFIQYFGDQNARRQTGYGLSPDYFDLIVSRDPLFVNSHLKLAVSTSLFAGYPQKTVEFLGKSLEKIPPKLEAPVYPPYYLWIYKGIDQLLFLGDIEGAKHSNTMAAKWAETYPDEASQRTAANKRETVKFLENNPKSKIPQIGAWAQVLSGAADKKTEDRALAEIQALGGQIIRTPDGRLNVRVPDNIR
ncbi:hypothetical protein [Aphanothece sacrum]|uniref:Uncharacterized protein n=1 Tax=Aphanothece sacrum FPU1 TaxID=1920663 RepID=A0A401IBQ7_APHSA|nr:hypothetical protein [Aphanothece sacrum]GBF78713.1 hypothetical protein AsFPU1_0102 [Aphanothece sacrum FPU1]GBF86942.1 hypothetical protein AsFPU3_4019 [Aphanothece sacrum FPU3]